MEHVAPPNVESLGWPQCPSPWTIREPTPGRTDPDFVNDVSEKEQRQGAKAVPGSGHQEHITYPRAVGECVSRTPDPQGKSAGNGTQSLARLRRELWRGAGQNGQGSARNDRACHTGEPAPA
ncbi:uncharacterized protein ACBT57_023305 isoform 3-T3 [Dama dama]